MLNHKCILEKDLTHSNYLFCMSRLSHSNSYLLLFVISDVRSSFNMITLFRKFNVYILAWPLKTSLTWRKIPEWMTKMSCCRYKYDDQQIAWVRSGGARLPGSRIWLQTGWDALSSLRWELGSPATWADSGKAGARTRKVGSQLRHCWVSTPGLGLHNEGKTQITKTDRISNIYRYLRVVTG